MEITNYVQTLKRPPLREGPKYPFMAYQKKKIEYEYISFFAIEYEYNYPVGDMDLSP